MPLWRWSTLYQRTNSAAQALLIRKHELLLQVVQEIVRPSSAPATERLIGWLQTESAPLPDSASERGEQGLAARAQEKTVNASARRLVQLGVRLAQPAEAFCLVNK
jgi:hypothetical protein